MSHKTGLKTKQTGIKVKVRCILEQRIFYSFKTLECLLNVKNQKIMMGSQNNRFFEVFLSSLFFTGLCVFQKLL